MPRPMLGTLAMQSIETMPMYRAVDSEVIISASAKRSAPPAHKKN